MNKKKENERLKGKKSRGKIRFTRELTLEERITRLEEIVLKK